MEIFTAFLLAAGPVALGIRGVVDFVRRAIDPKSTFPSFIWPLLAIVLAMAYTFWGKVNLVPSVTINGNSPKISDTAGYVLTAIAIAGVAMYWNTYLANRQADTKLKAGEQPDGSLASPKVAQK